MHTLALASALVVLGTTLSLSLPSSPAPKTVESPPTPSAPPSETCSEKTLKGKWGMTFDGKILGPVSTFLPGSVSVVAVLDSNGAGAFTGSGKANINGVAVTQSGTGTYAVNRDCTGTATFRYPGWDMDVYFVITGDGDSRQVWFINTSKPVVVHGTLRRI